MSNSGRAAKQAVQRDPAERRARNRTLLMLSVLAMINIYVFVLRDEGAMLGLSRANSAVIGGAHSGPLAPLADPVPDACGGDPVRIFSGLSDLLPVSTTLVGGNTLRLALMDRGIADEEIDRIEAAVRSKVDLGLLGGSGAPVAIAMDRYGGVRALEIELAEGHLLQACRSGEGFTVRNIQHPLRSDVVVVTLTLGGDVSLANAVEQAGEEPELARVVAQQLGHDVDFHTESRPGDKVAIVIEKRWLGRSFHRYGQVLALRYEGAAGRVAYYRYKPQGGEEAFFDRKGRPRNRELLRSPVGWFPLSADARAMLVPTLEVVEGRLGAIYRLPEGAPIVAVADARVADSGEDLERGRWVDLELADGTVARYHHMMRTIGAMEAGSEVVQGQLLGLAGHSGKTPSNRLRFELWRTTDGVSKTVDPMLLTTRGANRPGRDGPEIAAGVRDQFVQDVAPRRRALETALR
ncbi:MAG: M23 family metallopeptidase [Nannocystaceae bacterium]|nr:M23 family metallopeptidase [Nannocystaceae bacterium]